MSLQTIVQQFARRTKLPVPTSVASNPDAQVAQIHGLLNELLEDLDTRKIWTDNIYEASFTTVAGADQGAITAIPGVQGFKAILNDTMFDRTTGLQLCGSVSPQEWQRRQAHASSGPYSQFRIRGGKILLDPVLGAGHEIAFEYHSHWFVRDALGNPKETFLVDTDTLVFGDQLAHQWLRWAWKKDKGFDYAEEFRSYENYLATLGMRDGAPAVIDTTRTGAPQFGYEVPLGSWNLS